MELSIKTCLISVLKIRYRICDKRYPGKPDLIFPRYYAVIFIKRLLLARSRRLPLFCLPKIKSGILWKKKFESNKKRDLEDLKYYQEKCWRVCFVFIYGIIFLSLQINNSPVSIFSKYSSGCFCSFCCFQ